jgi:ubiquinone/menaquinone biosynthesis C-methylase UbiE
VLAEGRLQAEAMNISFSLRSAGQRKRAAERAYYLSSENAAAFDARSAPAANLQRYTAVAEDVGKTETAGNLLDIGCGTARMLIEIAGAHPGMKMTGIDVSREMVGRGKRNVAEAGLSDRIALEHLSAEELAFFGDGVFDTVISSGCLSAWLNPVVTLGEIFRILKKGGRLLLYDWNRKTPLLTKAELLIGTGGDHELCRRIRMAFCAAYSPRELKRLVLRSPFSIEQLTIRDHWIVCRLKK